jgi:hypothetical protein
MGKVFENIHPELASWIKRQHLFFVGTAPLSAQGHVNLSPKGLDTFRIVDLLTVAYLDLTGSGAETIAHLRENGRIVFMFCAFEGPPKIVRLHGRGEVITPGSPRYSELVRDFLPLPGVRSVILAHINRVSDSCGYAVPRYGYQADRDGLQRWASNRGEAEILAYQAEKNARSIDGLPALP